MACGLITGLSTYSFLVTAILVIISALYANSPSGTRITCKENHVNDNIKTQTHVDLFNVDIIPNSIDRNGEKNSCSVIEVLGFRVFETIILTLIFLGMIFVAFKMVVRIRHFLLKQTEKRALAEKRKFEKMRLEYEKNKAKPRQRDIENDVCAEEPETSPAQQKKKMTVKFYYTSEKDDQ